MVALAMELTIFILGFCAAVGIAMYQAWVHLSTTSAQLEYFLVALPIIVWGAAYAYNQTYSFLTAISTEQIGWAVAWYREYWVVEMAPLFSAGLGARRLAIRPSLGVAV